MAVRTRWVDYKDKEFDAYCFPLSLWKALLSYQYSSPEMIFADIGAMAVPDRAQIEPGWHAWMSYMVDKPPVEDAVLKTGQRAWELPGHRPNLTASRAAFKTYST